MTNYVYMIDFPHSGEFYVGVRTCKGDPEKDTQYRGSGTLVMDMIRIHPYTKMIIATLPSRKDAERLEAILVNHRHPKSLNQCEGGGGGPLGHRHSEETKAKFRVRKFSKETRAKISAAHKGKVTSEQTKTKMRKAHLGKKMSEAAREKMRARIYSDETREKMRQAKLGAPQSEAQVAGRSRAWTPERKKAYSTRMKAQWASKR